MEIKIDMSGLHELERKIENLSKGQMVQLVDLFPPAFMRKYTDFATIDEMEAAWGKSMPDNSDFSDFIDDDWEALVAAKTQFSSWQEMLNQGGSEWASRELGLA